MGGREIPAWADLPAYRRAFRARNPLPDLAPALLAGRSQWLMWRYEPGETAEKKPRKMPYYADGGRRFGDQGSDRDRARLVDFAAAVEAAAAADMDGVGLAFLPGDGLVGIDLDAMINPDTGEVSERLEQIVAACDSYTEWSPSGTGVHVIGLSDEAATFKSNKIGIEVFVGRQFFTFTGARFGDAPADVEPISPAVIRRLYVTVKGKPEPSPVATVPAAPPREQVGGKVRSLAETVALAEEALQSLDCDEYQQWIEIGMACKAGLGSAGYLVWDTWSARSAKYAGGDDTAKRWAGFEPSTIGLAALFSRAESAGWVSPWAKARERKGKRSKPAKPASSASVEDVAKLATTETGRDAAKAAAGGGDGLPPGDDSGPDPDDEDWSAGLIYSKGDLSTCLANVDLILSHSKEWRGVIGYDEFAERTAFRRRLPHDLRGPAQGEWTDLLDATTAIHLQRQHRVAFRPETVGQAVEVVARKARFHPVREALEALPAWDGTERLRHWLGDYLGVAETEYVQLVGRFFLIGMVKRVYEPGCKFDACLVLEGEQGLGKSTAARILAWHWFADTDLDLSNKDSLLALPGHWVYEISEMGSLMKAEERKQKSFLSRQEDEYRPPYGKRMVRVPRQSVFIGTTNEEEYLKDATGGRRFWPVLCEHDFNLDGLLDAREQLFAEALEAYRARERCYPSQDEQAQLFTPEQTKRGMPEPFEDILYAWVEKQVVPFSMADAACDGLSLTPDKLTPAVVTRLGIVLKRLGCVRIEDRNAADPGRRRLYLSPKLAAKQAGAVKPAQQSRRNAHDEGGDHDW